MSSLISKKKTNVIGNAATEQKKQNDFIDLLDDMLDENNPFNDQIKTEGKYIEVNLFDDTDSKDIKNVSNSVIEEINFGDSIEIPFDNEVAIDGPKKIKKRISNPNSICFASNRIIKKYRKQRQKKKFGKNK